MFLMTKTINNSTVVFCERQNETIEGQNALKKKYINDAGQRKKILLKDRKQWMNRRRDW